MMNLTEKAAEQIKRHKTDFESHEYLRIGVRAGGCSGFQYEMYWEDDNPYGDIILVIHGVTIVIDPDSGRLLDGAELDWKEGLMGAGFVWNNPNATRSCGCGKSFS